MTSRQRYSPFTQLAFLFIFIGLGIVAGSACTLLFANIYLGASAENVAELISKSNDPFVYRIIQVINVVFVMILPAIFFARVQQTDVGNYLRFTKAISGKQAFLIVSMVLAALMVSGSLGALNEQIPLPDDWSKYFRQLEANYNKQVLTLSSMKTVQDYLAGLVILALLPAIAEEMIFRGCLQQVFTNIARNAWIGIIITSLLFSAIHLSFYGFLPRLFLGIMLGYIFYKGDNMWLNTLVHFLNNAFALTQMYAISRNGETPTDALEENLPVFYGVIGVTLLVFLFRIFNQESEFVLSMYRSQNRDTGIKSSKDD